MRLLSFRSDEGPSFGALVEGRIVDLGAHMPEHESLRALLEANALVRALDTAAEESARFRIEKVILRAPIPDPGKLLCVFDDPEGEPTLIDPKFLRGDGRELPIPVGDANPLAVGVAMVLGRSADELQIIGVTLMSYLSPGALSMGPCLVTLDELESVGPLSVKVGEKEQTLSLPDVGAIVRRLSADYELNAADVIAFLTYLTDIPAEAGETVEISCPDIGVLKNPVQAEIARD